MSQPVLTVLSFGGGQDSTALLHLYINDETFRRTYAPGRFVVVMSDTGDEHPETLQHVENVKELCRQAGIEFHHLTPDLGYHSGTWTGLIEHYRATTTIGSKAYPKTCTDRLKLKPIYLWLEAWLGQNYGTPVGKKKGFYAFTKQHGPIHVLLGIAEGEDHRVGGGEDPQRWMRENILKRYPLRDLGLDRQGCQDLIAKYNQPVPPPSNCMRCMFMSEIELLYLYRFHQDKYQEWVELEAAKLAKWKDKGPMNFGVWGRKTLPEVLAKAQEKYGHLTDAQLREYKMSHGHCVKSKWG